MKNSKRVSTTQTMIPIPPFDIVFESNQMFALLHSELDFILEKMGKAFKEQRWRRIYIRSLFAFIESCAYRLKQDAMIFKKFPLKEVYILKEKRYHLNDKGEIVEENLHLKTLANLRFSFDVYARAWDINFKLDISDVRWEDLKKALKIRHRITHPKNLKDLVISNDEWLKVMHAEQWFYEELSKLHHAVVIAQKEKTPK